MLYLGFLVFRNNGSGLFLYRVFVIFKGQMQSFFHSDEGDRC